MNWRKGKSHVRNVIILPPGLLWGLNACTTIAPGGLFFFVLLLVRGGERERKEKEKREREAEAKRFYSTDPPLSL